MKTNLVKIFSAALLGAFLFAGSIQAGGTAEPGTLITKEDATKKYPAPKGGYPRGERDIHAPSGWVASPYPPHTVFDCSKIGHGELALDTHVNKVFVRP